MTLEKIKKEFVKHMEETRRGDPYPRNFMGCLISIIIEPEPTSQERLMELTGYSQATISLTLQKIQLLMPVKTIKKRGDRKKYFTYDGSPESFILDLWQKRLYVQGIDINQIDTMIEEVKEKASNNSAITRFFNYLRSMKLFLTLIHTLRAKSIEQYEHVLKGASIEDVDFHENNNLEKSVIEDFLQELRTTAVKPDLDEAPKTDYLLLKNLYFTGIKANLNPLYSQTIANQMMVLHDVFLEGQTTQGLIEKSTLLPRSTISELLSQFESLGVIRVSMKEGTRIKLYRPAISFTDFMFSQSDRLVRDTITGIAQLIKFVSSARKIRSTAKETEKFLDVLSSFEKAYTFTLEVAKRFKATMVAKLKDEYDRGFVFI